MPFLPPPRISDVLAQNRETIVDTIGTTIAESLESAVAANGGQPHDVWMLYSFFMRGMPALERRLNNILGAFSIRVTISGILCHKNPLVEFQYDRPRRVESRSIRLKGRPPPNLMETVNGRCELADIAFLTTYGGRLRGGGIGNALLAQTKREPGDLGSNEDQIVLYRQVQDFRYFARSHGRDHRRLPPKNDPALWHWVLDAGHHAHPYRGNSWFGHPLSSHLDAVWHPTGWAIYQLLTGVIGNGFALPVANDQGWDRIIDDLIRSTCQKTTRCKNAYAATLQTFRGEQAAHAVHGVLSRNGGQVVKNSFGRIFGGWGDEELASLGRQLEDPKEQFSEDELIRESAEGGEPPGQKLKEGSGSDGEGSFVIIDIEDLQEPSGGQGGVTPLPTVQGSKPFETHIHINVSR